MVDKDEFYSEDLTRDESAQKALDMIRRGKSLGEIVKATGLRPEEVRELSGEY